MLLLLAGLRSFADSPSQFEGKHIAEVFFEPASQPLTRDQLGLAINLRPGDIFAAQALSGALERLYRTGRFETIDVDARLNEQGALELTFRTTPRFFIGGVFVDGVPEPPTAGKLVNSTKLELGTEFDPDDLPQAKDLLSETLRSNGFHTAQVTYVTNKRSDTEEMDVTFMVNPGPRSQFAKPTFLGDGADKEKRLIRETGWLRLWGIRGYQPFTEARLQQGIDKVRKYYLDRGHLRAVVQVDHLDQDPDHNAIRPFISIAAGPSVIVRTEGAKVSNSDIRRLVPIYQERTVDAELLLEGKRNLTDFFQNKGYFDVKVTYAAPEDQGKGDIEVTYTVERGPRSKLTSIAIDGNRYFDRNTILERIDIEPASRFHNRRGRFSRPMLDHDLEVIADLYRSNGFRDVAVDSRVDRKPAGKEDEVGVSISVKEGQQWLVGELEISGVDLKLLPEIEGRLSSTRGQPFSTTNVLNDRDTILAYYFNSGYPEAEFTHTTTPVEAEHRMNVRYVIREGRRNFVRDVLITGLDETKPDLVLSRLQLAAGEPLSQGRLIETQRRLYDLGIFSMVNVAVQNPEGRERNKYVLIQTEEARRYSVTFGFGAEFGRIGGGTSFDTPAGKSGFSPRVLLGVSRLNMFGVGHVASLTTRFSNIEQRAALTYFAPHFKGNDRYNLTFSAFGDQSKDIRTFTSQRVEGAMQLAQRVSRPLTVQYRLSWRLVHIPPDSLNISPGLIPIYSQPARVGLASIGFVQDRRDDPLEPTRGIFNTGDFGYSGKALASNTTYTRLVGRNSTYYKIRRDVIFARSTSAGWLYNFRITPIPLPENFFGGGATTHRGFPDNQAGPRDPTTGYPIGGQAFLFNNLELRFPMFGSSVGGVIFEDAGNVYSTASDISFRYKQKNPEDFNYMVQAIGFGVRIKTPIGPFRVDLAYAPNAPKFFGYSGTRDDLINGVPGTTVLQHINKFQFHFSIGQAF
jgi:outer membrane protein insertion porin family